MTWTLVNRAHAASRAIADRHYNRQSIGSAQFVPPGRSVVLLSELETALWVTSWQFPQFVKHAWPGAWVNSLFRRERNGDDGFAGIEDDHAASDLIRSAVAATRSIWSPPTEGLVTFVDPTKVQPIRRRRHACDCNCGLRRIVGYSYEKAGFVHAGFTAGGLWAWRMRQEAMPAPEAPLLLQARLEWEVA